MSEMIERVERALYSAYAGPEPITPWERISARDQEMHRKLARAAIEAIEKGGHRILSESDLDEIRQSGYDQGYETATALCDANRY